MSFPFALNLASDGPGGRKNPPPGIRVAAGQFVDSVCSAGGVPSPRASISIRAATASHNTALV
jgi:hypothetical protein